MNLWRVPIDERTGRLLGEPETVTSGASVSAFHPSFSAGGQRLLYVSRLAEVNLHKVRLDPLTGTTEGAPVPITRGSTQVDAPAVSPDGEWLAYVRIGTREDLFVMRLDGSERRQLTDDLFKDRLPRWTSDGERLVFYSDRSGSYEAWSIRPDGSDMQALTDTPQHSVIWPDVSPDGSLLAYSALLQGKSYIRDLRDGKTLEIPPVDETGDTFEPYAWSPNGRWLAGQVFTSDREPRGVFLRDVETGEFRQLTDHGNNPIWLHDGRRLLFWSDAKLFLLDSETGASHELLSIERSVIGTQFDVSPNDDWVYFRLSTAESDIWSITQN